MTIAVVEWSSLRWRQLKASCLVLISSVDGGYWIGDLVEDLFEKRHALFFSGVDLTA